MPVNLVESRAARALPLLAFLYFTICSIAPIRSYDYFWHLATGRWIVEHRAFPLADPFTVASDQTPWINGEWLFQVPLYGLHASGGHLVVRLARAGIVGAIFALGLLSARKRLSPGLATALIWLCWWGSLQRLGTRPATVAALLAVLAVQVLQDSRGMRRSALFALLTALWINIHPSALIAPVMAALWAAAEWWKERSVTSAGRMLTLTGPSLLALLVNPYGWQAVTAPLSLARWVSSGAFTNVEWLPTLPRQFPLFYGLALLGLVAAVISLRRTERLPRILLLALFTLLALRSVRHQSLFYATWPLLAPALLEGVENVRSWFESGARWAAIGLTLFGFSKIELRPSIDPNLFPVRAVEQLERSGLAGNIFNADQFGGFLIWSFYPERRVLWDGRNELYRSLIPLDRDARRDSRAWNHLLRTHRINLAVDEYRPPVEVRLAGREGHREMPASAVFFPRESWALIGFDDVAMVFARRAAFDQGRLARLEYQTLVPDDRSPQFRSDEKREQVARELERARREAGEQSRVVARLEAALR